MKYKLTTCFFALLCFSACQKDDNTELGGSIGETKQIAWQEILKFEDIPEATSVINFTVSDDGNIIFFSNSNRNIYRHNLTNGQTTKLYGDASAMGTSYVHFIDGKLYTITISDNKSYFGISTDLGDNLTQHLVHTYNGPNNPTPVESFYTVNMNRLYKMPNGTLVLPDNASNMNFALSTDGGLTWSRKETEINYTFIPAQNGNRLFCLTAGWEGEFGIGNAGGLFYSDNLGDSWQQSDLNYAPQATDREGNLIACESYQFQKLKNGKWTLYEWEDNFPYGVKLRNFNGNQEYVDIEFDSSNNLYLLSNNTIYRTKLN